jgi:hypothetical protein
MGQDGSDVYVYMHISGSYHCCGCKLHLEFGTVAFDEAHEIIDHLVDHYEAGHTVPGYVIRTILEEA